MMSHGSGWAIRGTWFLAISLAAVAAPPALADAGNIKTGSVTGMPAGVAVADMAMNRQKNQIVLAGYQYDYGNNEGHVQCIPDPVLIVDAVQDKLIGGPDNEKNCQAIALGVSPDGSKAYVSVMASSAGGYQVEVVDLRPNPSHVDGVLQGIPSSDCLTPATSIAFSPDGSKAYVAYGTCSDGNMASRIAVIDAGNDTFLHWVTGLPGGVAYGTPYVKFDPDPARSLAYVTDIPGPWNAASGLNAVWAVNTQTDAWEKTIASKQSNARLGDFDFSPAGDKAFVADSSNCGLTTIDVAGSAQAGFTPFASCDQLSSVAVSPGGSTVYAVGSSSDDPGGTITPQFMDSAGHKAGLVANYDGTNSSAGPIVFSTKNGTTAYVSRSYYVFDQTKQLDVLTSDIAIVRLPAVPAQAGKVSPSTGVSAGGTQILISGSHLAGTTSVLFGKAAATNLQVVSDAAVTVSTPAAAVGPVDVTVVNPGGNATLNRGFTYTTGYNNGGAKLKTGGPHLKRKQAPHR
jgi:hypothetical protein